MSDAIRPLRTAKDHAAALEEAAALVGANGADADRLAVLSVLIADYERRIIDAPTATPMEVVALDMRLNSRSQADLARVLGSRSRASELLAGRRALTPAMADRLAAAWSIPRDLLGEAAVKKPRRRVLRAVAAVAFIFLAAGMGGYAWTMSGLPDITPLTRAPHGDRLALEDIPVHVRQAFLAAEDADFYRRDGVSLRGVVRASVDCVGNLLRGARPAGGAGITEQVVKNVLLSDRPRSLRRRVQEAVLAQRVEAALSKDQIFEIYLNRVYFGGGVWGLRAAALRYFGVEPRSLTVAQAASLAAMAPAPNMFRLDRPENLARARERRDWVLARMREQGFLTASARDEARAAPL